MSLGTTYSPAVPVGREVVTGKCTDVFRGIFFGLGGELRGEGYVGGYFHGETSHGKREFQ